ncbi:hypothetical protein GWI33_000715 [Rhynchophorus ferrugineus]|uniref:Chitin-binding type-2 domain-containing protein n=1 Tax=Rhynchophorus ferrugineus TaxID=354439 RepID=A0A834ILW4_RHYFE|nr:hypothetical protein GWI33_000715 [Rhynchophorus ferrugineus]
MPNMVISLLPFLLVALTGVSGQFKCPQGTGYFPDLEQCDLYYECSKGNYEEKLCPDGLVFDDSDPNHERCDIPANVECGDRTALQEAKPSKGCPRANGYYRHEDPEICDKFFNCVDGTPVELPCPPEMGFSLRKVHAQVKQCTTRKFSNATSQPTFRDAKTTLMVKVKLPHSFKQN